MPPPENLIARIHMGLVGDGGDWGELFLNFMQSENVAQIYAYHGLSPKSKKVADICSK